MGTFSRNWKMLRCDENLMKFCGNFTKKKENFLEILDKP